MPASDEADFVPISSATCSYCRGNMLPHKSGMCRGCRKNPELKKKLAAAGHAEFRKDPRVATVVLEEDSAPEKSLGQVLFETISEDVYAEGTRGIAIASAPPKCPAVGCGEIAKPGGWCERHEEMRKNDKPLTPQERGALASRPRWDPRKPCAFVALGCAKTFDWAPAKSRHEPCCEFNPNNRKADAAESPVPEAGAEAGTGVTLSVEVPIGFMRRLKILVDSGLYGRSPEEAIERLAAEAIAGKRIECR